MPRPEKYDDDAILLKLHREFSKDEACAILFKEISALKFKIGELISENEELKYELDIKNKVNTNAIVWTNKEFRAMVKEKDEQINELNKKYKEFRNKFIELSVKLHNESVIQ